MIYHQRLYILLSVFCTWIAGWKIQPPETWKEHWFTHQENLTRISYDSHVAIYADSCVDVKQASWVFPLLTASWQYVKKFYGNFNDDGLMVVLHCQPGLRGGHPGYHHSSLHGHRNVIDVGVDSWEESLGIKHILLHEIGHIVETTSFNNTNSPSFSVWRDSMWCQIFIYDLVKNVDPKELDQTRDTFIAVTVDFPKPGARWFQDWLYPLYEKYGQVQLYSRYFKLLAEQASNVTAFNLGEYVYFTSKAAGENLLSIAMNAFHNPEGLESQFQAAEVAFGNLAAKSKNVVKKRKFNVHCLR